MSLPRNSFWFWERLTEAAPFFSGRGLAFSFYLYVKELLFRICARRKEKRSAILLRSDRRGSDEPTGPGAASLDAFDVFRK